MAIPVPMSRGQVAAVIKTFRSDTVRVDFTVRRAGAATPLVGKGQVTQYDKTAGKCVVMVEHSSVSFDAPPSDNDLQFLHFQIEGGGSEDLFALLESRAALSTVEMPDYVGWLPQLRDTATSLHLRDRITKFLGLPDDCLTRDVWDCTPTTRDDYEIDNLVGLLRQQLAALAVTVQANGTPTSSEMGMLEHSFGRLYVMKIKKDHPKDAEYLTGRLRRQCSLLNALRDMNRARTTIREKELLDSVKKQ